MWSRQTLGSLLILLRSMLCFALTTCANRLDPDTYVRD